MIRKVNKEEAQRVLKGLALIYTREEIAVSIGKTVASIYMWQSGKRTPDKANFQALKKLLGE